MSPAPNGIAHSLEFDELASLRVENAKLRAALAKAEGALHTVFESVEAVLRTVGLVPDEKAALNGVHHADDLVETDDDQATVATEATTEVSGDLSEVTSNEVNTEATASVPDSSPEKPDDSLLLSSDDLSSVSERALPETGRLPDEYYAGFLSELSKARMPSAIRALFPLENTPGVLSMLAGKPNAETFPINAIQLLVRSPYEPEEEVTLEVKGKELAEALQYGPTAGLPALVKWLEGLQAQVHHRYKDEGWRISVGAGSQDLLYKAFLALLDSRDTILIEAPVYAGVIPIIDSLKCNIAEIPTDYDGIDAPYLRNLLENWPADKPFPKLLYTVPYGCNPSGTTAPDSRRAEVLALARQYKFLIMEDDPYYFLYYGTAPRPTSYFRMEKEDGKGTGHVVRFDSLSKILSSGLRVGWVSGPTKLLEAFDLHTSSSNLQPSSTTQAISYSYLRYVGIDGFLKHTAGVSAYYGAKAEIFGKAMEKYLTGLATWAPPTAGMFFWFKLLLPPSADSAEGDSGVLIRTKAYENGVIALPGTAFYAKGQPTPFVRASFSLLSEEECFEALRRLAEVLRAA